VVGAAVGRGAAGVVGRGLRQLPFPATLHGAGRERHFKSTGCLSGCG
jgi:hypothetical protein